MIENTNAKKALTLKDGLNFILNSSMFNKIDKEFAKILLDC